MRREVNYDEVFDAQQHFRLVLDGMARPGKINNFPAMDIVPPAGLNNASAIIAFALLNTDASFYAEGDNSEEIEGYIALNTSAQAAGLSEADFVFINGLHDAGIIFEAKTGTLSYPEESATFIINAEGITGVHADNAIMLNLKGPGIETEKLVYIKGINPEILKAVREQNFEFPLGIDLIITDEQNNILCIPRSNQFTIEGAALELTGINN